MKIQDLICRYCSCGTDGTGGHTTVQLHPRTAPVCDDKKKMNIKSSPLSWSHQLTLSCHNSKHIQPSTPQPYYIDLYVLFMILIFYQLNCVKCRTGVM